MPLAGLWDLLSAIHSPTETGKPPINDTHYRRAAASGHAATQGSVAVRVRRRLLLAVAAMIDRSLSASDLHWRADGRRGAPPILHRRRLAGDEVRGRGACCGRCRVSSIGDHRCLAPAPRRPYVPQKRSSPRARRSSTARESSIACLVDRKTSRDEKRITASSLSSSCISLFRLLLASNNNIIQIKRLLL